jgi:asparagine synthase (glutamine-hydrolysing)
MCGITGVYNLNGEAFSLHHLKLMAEAIAHRGPDGEGYFVEENIALAHKRLSILDTSARGAQPMSSKDGNWVITFNGCVYNFMELKQELMRKGHEFVSTTDTEVISEGLAAYGPEFFERLNGMSQLQLGIERKNACILAAIALV